MEQSSIVLSACIPTYNRNQDLALRLNELKCIESIFTAGFMEVCIQDNSNHHFRTENQNLCKSFNVNYEANESNIGLGGSVYKLTQRARGKYIIFLSDNDRINIKNFAIVAETLEAHIRSCEANYKRLSLFMVPFNIADSIRYDLPQSSTECTLNEALLENPARFPGCLLSSCIIPNNKVSFARYHESIESSIFPQILTIFILTKGTDSIAWTDLPVVTYTEEEKPRFRIIEVIRSELELIEIVSKINNIVAHQLWNRKRRALISLLLSCFWFRIGRIQLTFSAKPWRLSVMQFTIENIRLITPKSFALLIVLFLPFPKLLQTNLPKNTNVA